VYTVIPCTLHPGVQMPFEVSALCSATARLEPLGGAGDMGSGGGGRRRAANTHDGSDGGDNEEVTVGWSELHASGRWAASAATAGGCPNELATWWQNPLFELRVSRLATAVVSLAVPAAALGGEHGRAEELARAEWRALLARDAEAAAEANARAARLAPAVGILVLRGAAEGLAGADYGARALHASKFVYATSELHSELRLPTAGVYTVLPCTFAPGVEAPFTLGFYCTDDAFDVTAANGGGVVLRGGGGEEQARLVAEAAAGAAATASTRRAPLLARCSSSENVLTADVGATVHRAPPAWQRTEERLVLVYPGQARGSWMRGY
jgi:hypothetical protein